jgi:hypothetical protein
VDGNHQRRPLKHQTISLEGDEMAVILNGIRNFAPAPEGLHAAVCVDVVDRGLKETRWGLKHKLMLVWEINARMDNGRPFTVHKHYTCSLHEKSILHKDLKAWRGRPFTPEELDAFDLETVLNSQCQVLVTHATRDGTVYADVTTVTKAVPGQNLQPSGHYVRVQDRKSQPGARTIEDVIPF